MLALSGFANISEGRGKAIILPTFRKEKTIVSAFSGFHWRNTKKGRGETSVGENAEPSAKS